MRLPIVGTACCSLVSISLSMAGSLGANRVQAGQEPARPGSVAARPVAGGAGIPLSRYIPRRSLRAYLSFDGVENHAEAWALTSTKKVLGDTKLGALLEDLLSQVGDQVVASVPGRKLSGADVAAIIEHALKHGIVLAVHEGPEGETRTTAVFREAFRAETRPLFARLIGTLMAPPAGVPDVNAKPAMVTKPGDRGIAVMAAGSPLETAFWIEKDRDLIVCRGNGAADPIIAALEGTDPDASTHPAHESLAIDRDGFSAIGRGFVDLDGVAAGNPLASQNGLDKFKWLELRVGFQGDALITSLGLESPAPRQGFPGLIDQPGFSRDEIPAIPATQASFTVFSLDLPRMYDQAVAIARLAAPAVAGVPAALENPTTRKALDEAFKPLGTTFAFYTLADTRAATPPPAGPAAGPLAGFLPLLKAKGAIVTTVNDAAAITRALDSHIPRVNDALKDQFPTPPSSGGQGQAGGADAASRFQAPEFKRVGVGSDRTFLMNLPVGWVALGATARPTIKTNKTHAVLATDPALADRVLEMQAHEAFEKWVPTGAVARAFERLPARMTLLNVGDAEASYQGLIAVLGVLSQATGATRPGGPPPGPGLPPGVSGAGATPPAIRIDPAKVPRAEDLRGILLPPITTAVVDERGGRILFRGTFPLGGPAESGIGVALILPAIQQSRVAARRAVEAREGGAAPGAGAQTRP